MEKLVYEIRPYAFLVMSLTAFYHAHGSRLMLASAAILLFAVGIIVYSRMKHRHVIA